MLKSRKDGCCAFLLLLVVALVCAVTGAAFIAYIDIEAPTHTLLIAGVLCAVIGAGFAFEFWRTTK